MIFRGKICERIWSAKERSGKLTSDAGVADVDVCSLGRVLENSDVTCKKKSCVKICWKFYEESSVT